jgi:hypothetical protein
MSDILIAPYSTRLKSGLVNPKSYPYWNKLVDLLVRDGYRITQIGVTGEEKIEGVLRHVLNASFSQIRALVLEHECFITIDSFLPHLVHAEKLGKRGIVLFGPSDPLVFGYPENTNLLRGRDYLRPHQFQTWNEIDYDPQRFVYAENVMPHVYKLAPLVPQGLALTSHVPVTATQSA